MGLCARNRSLLWFTEFLGNYSNDRLKISIACKGNVPLSCKLGIILYDVTIRYNKNDGKFS